jgi:hypothetical protein
VREGSESVKSRSERSLTPPPDRKRIERVLSPRR